MLVAFNRKEKREELECPDPRAGFAHGGRFASLAGVEIGCTLLIELSR
jgi:hypothetical protein